MNGTHHDLQAMAHYISCYGLHTGVQMAVCDSDGLFRLDIAAIAYHVTEDAPGIPDCFLTDEVAALTLIESSDRAMACIRAISDAIRNYEVPATDGQPDVIEHVSNWVATVPIDAPAPPTASEVIGCILRAATRALNHAA